jgi:heat shock protein HspQ
VSPEPSKQPLFSLGQLVHHKRYDYRGVVVGFDATCKAEDGWYEFQTKGKDYRPTKDQPWYNVLVHGASHTTYVAQQNLEPDPCADAIEHPLLGSVFSTFLGGRYYRESLN